MEKPGSGAGLSGCPLDCDVRELKDSHTTSQAASRPTATAHDYSNERVRGAAFRPLASVLPVIVEAVSAATIGRAESEGDHAKATQLRAAYYELWEARDGA